MSKAIKVQLHEETDGVNAHIEVVEESIFAAITFKCSPHFPLVVDEKNLREMKKEIDIVLKKLTETKKEINGTKSTSKRKK